MAIGLFRFILISCTDTKFRDDLCSTLQSYVCSHFRKNWYWEVLIKIKFDDIPIFVWDQPRITSTLHEDLHVFLCMKVTGWEIPRIPWLPGECLAICPSMMIPFSQPSHLLKSKTPLASLVLFTKIQFWKMCQNSYAVHIFPSLFCKKKSDILKKF